MKRLCEDLSFVGSAKRKREIRNPCGLTGTKKI